MNRRKIFGWLAGVLGAGAAYSQDKTGAIGVLPAGKSGQCIYPNEAGTEYHWGDCLVTPEWHKGKAKNNQCPVCGTMAEKWALWVEGSPLTLGTYDFERDKRFASVLPIRCAKCNSAFFRDAE